MQSQHSLLCIAASCALVPTLALTTPALEQEKIASVPNSAPIFRQLGSHCSVKINENFSAIILASGANTTDYESSSDCEVQQIDGEGSAEMGNLPARWSAHYRLNKGCLMLHSDKAVLVEVDKAMVFIDKGVNAVLHKQENASRIVNLTDRHQASMRVIYQERFIDLDPGQELVIVNSAERNAKAVAIQEGIGWKNMHFTRIGDALVFVYRVSAGDMLKKCKIYQQLAGSRLKSDQRLKEELVKTVAALEQMYNRKKGPYTVDEPYSYGTKEKQATRSAGSVSRFRRVCVHG